MSYLSRPLRLVPLFCAMSFAACDQAPQKTSEPQITIADPKGLTRAQRDTASFINVYNDVAAKFVTGEATFIPVQTRFVHDSINKLSVQICISPLPIDQVDTCVGPLPDNVTGMIENKALSYYSKIDFSGLTSVGTHSRMVKSSVYFDMGEDGKAVRAYLPAYKMVCNIGTGQYAYAISKGGETFHSQDVSASISAFDHLKSPILLRNDTVMMRTINPLSYCQSVDEIESVAIQSRMKYLQTLKPIGRDLN